VELCNQKPGLERIWQLADPVQLRVHGYFGTNHVQVLGIANHDLTFREGVEQKRGWRIDQDCQYYHLFARIEAAQVAEPLD
jgi:hypothetical protein